MLQEKVEKGKKKKELPKIHPILIKYLLPMTLFLRLDAMNYELPNYDEEVISVPLDEAFGIDYLSYISDISSAIIENKSLLGVLASDSLSVPDLPFVSNDSMSSHGTCDSSSLHPFDVDGIPNKDQP